MQWGNENFWDFDTQFTEITPQTPTVKTFRLDARERDVDYKPGQFFFVTIKINGIDANHHFTISSSPTEKGYLEFTKRITAHEFSQTLNTLKPGEWAHVRGPAGYFTLPDTFRKLAFLSGGIGITPMRSMLRYIADKNLNWDITLVYGNPSYDEIVFRDELARISEIKPGIRIEHVLSGSQLPPNWKGKTGFINKELVMETMPDYMERLFYVSGPAKMVISLEEQLFALGLSRDQVKRDFFTGYD